ncbi:MAG: POTRA domain-containing protein [Vicinamibacterales bacterium]
MDPRRVLTLLVLCAALVSPRMAHADVTDYIGKLVASVTLLNEGRVISDPRLRQLVDTAPGQPLRMQAVRESITHLFSLGQYADVRVSARLVQGRVALTYELVPLRPIEAFAFNGAFGPGLDSGRLRQMLTERFGRSPRPSRVREMVAAVEESLGDAGYLDARVTARLDTSPDADSSTLTFTVAPGPRARVDSIRVSGTPGMSEAEFLSRLDIAPGDYFVRQSLNGKMERYLADRRRRGYYQVRLGLSARPAADPQRVALTFVVDQGPLVRVMFEGDPIPSDRREDLVPVAREGSADEDLLEDSSLRIVELFRAQGYRDAEAPFTREEVGGELLITFHVRKGGQYRVEAVSIAGNEVLPSDQLRARMRVDAGQPFSAAALSADLRQLEALYHQQGFASAQVDAHIEASPAQPDMHVPVTVRVEVVENARTIVNSVSIEGNTSVPTAALREGLSLAPGAFFSQSKLSLDRDAIELHYANLGYQSVTVETRPGIEEDGGLADVVFVVREGPRVFVDHVLIVGNDRTKTETIERELRFKSGDPLGLEALSESQRRLAALGLFRRARITQIGRGDETRRDVLVTVEEAPLTTVGWGGGFEVRSRVVRAADDPTTASERVQVAPRATFEVGRRNLFGTNRSINLFTSSSLHPRNSPVFAQQDPSSIPSSGYGFLQYRVLGQFRQPRIFRSTDFRITGTLEQQIRSSFNFARRSTNAELATRLTRFVSVSGGYQIQRTRVFGQNVELSQQRAIDRLFPKVRLSSFLLSVIRDTRDDPVDPSRGQYLTVNGQLAARAIGSEVGFFKSFVAAQAFRTLPGAGGIVLATSARLGAALGFPNAAGSRDLPASERFFAGGDTTVRGFALDRLGVRHTPASDSDTLDPAGFPLGGNALLLFNGELRIPLRDGLRVVGFTDVGNVFKTVSDVTVGELRPAVGFGFRYKSPVGPLRFDLGFKVPRRPGEAQTAWFITFGEAF